MPSDWLGWDAGETEWIPPDFIFGPFFSFWSPFGPFWSLFTLFAVFCVDSFFQLAPFGHFYSLFFLYWVILGGYMLYRVRSTLPFDGFMSYFSPSIRSPNSMYPRHILWNSQRPEVNTTLPTEYKVHNISPRLFLVPRIRQCSCYTVAHVPFAPGIGMSSEYWSTIYNIVRYPRLPLGKVWNHPLSWNDRA